MTTTQIGVYHLSTLISVHEASPEIAWRNALAERVEP